MYQLLIGSEERQIMSNTNQKNQKKKNQKSESLRSLLKRPALHVHFVGIGGVSMYSLAVLSEKNGYTVSGSDMFINERCRLLSLSGIPVFTGHSEDNIGSSELIVYSHAISEDNPERIAAKERGVPQVSRAEYLGELMLKYRERIGVSGTHGKSTTVAILERIFTSSGRNPTVLSGAELESGSPIRDGGETLIYEACEYRESFLSFSPSVSLALNLELDHTDCYGNIQELGVAFVKALSRASRLAIINLDDENLKKIYPEINKKTEVVTFGQGAGCEYGYFINSFNEKGYSFSLSHFGSEIGKFELNILGVHNVTNAVAAIVLALECGVPLEQVRGAVAAFSGISRRLECIGNRHGRKIYYDYAHHPTEISAGINTLKMLYKEPLTVVFKPHTFTRTLSLWEDFCNSLSLADRVLLTDIYPAREKPIEGINSRRLAEDIGLNAEYCPDPEVVGRLDSQHIKGPVVLMGAGDLDAVKYDIFNK